MKSPDKNLIDVFKSILVHKSACKQTACESGSLIQVMVSLHYGAPYLV